MGTRITKPAHFEWNENRSKAAVALAEGKTRQQVADECEVSRRTIQTWLEHPEFAVEVDRLSLMVANAGRAYRLRIVNRVIRQKVEDETVIKTDKDLLEWLKYAQSETDGVKIGLTEQLTALLQDDSPVARGGSK